MADDADARTAEFFGSTWKFMSDRDRMVWQNARKSDLQRHLSGVTDAIAAVVERGAAMSTFDDQVRYLTERIAFIRRQIEAVRTNGGT